MGQLQYAYDGFERASRTYKISNSVSLATTYTFKAGTGAGTTTLIPQSMNTAGPNWNDQYSYTYDSMGNIATVSHGGNTTRYTYDSLNQLTREDNQAAGKSWVYSYDTGGNITSAKEYAYTTGNLGSVQSTRTYTYGDSNWRDKLTSYAGSSITYDAIGNPLSYRGMTFTWDMGRQLKTVTSGGTTTTYKYNSSGIRTSKTTGSVTTEYFLEDSRVVRSSDGTNVVMYFYDENGSPVSFRAKSGGSYSSYFYVKDLQGDIVAITDKYGAKVVEYTYDAWGKVLTTTGSLASTIGASNPYRYRGYWYDTETGLYYLQSRYYDPTTGRFINADILVSTEQGILGCNMFAYCENNPANYKDPNGSKMVICPIHFGQVIIQSYDEEQNDDKSIVLSSEHHKRGTTNPANKNKHQNGQSRKIRDAGNEKGDLRRQSRSNKRRTNIEVVPQFESTVGGISAVVASGIGILYIIGNDISIIGVLDDYALMPLITVFNNGIQVLIGK